VLRKILAPFQEASGARLLLILVALAMLPLAYYAGARMAGIIPTAEIWFARGSQHGPWHDDGRAWLFSAFIFSMSILAPFAVAKVFQAATHQEDRKHLPLAIAATIADLGLLWIYLNVVYWTID
jgi:hypothetical protein